MATTLLIRVECGNDSDFESLRVDCVAAVENVVDTQEEEERLDGEVSVSWDTEEGT